MIRCKLTSATVDNILCNMAPTLINGGKLYLDNGTATDNSRNSAPTATGLACKTTLETKSWDVRVAT